MKTVRFIIAVTVLFLALHSGVEAADTLPTCTVEPSTVKAGESAVLAIKGENPGSIDFTFNCDGVTVNSNTQNSATEIKVNFTAPWIPPDAAPEECCVTLISDIETFAPIECCFLIIPPDCTSHAYHDCYDGDSYWYDSCGNREEMFVECGLKVCLVGDCVDDSTPCIAEAILQDDEEYLKVLRDFRDKILLASGAGKKIVGFYYAYSPMLIKLIEEKPKVKEQLKQIIKALIPTIKKML